jgi:hypothetical protein
VFIEVGGTSTDITLIKEGRVRHRYATVGGQRLMVPALDLRTVAVGGGSMLRADAKRFGPRSAHSAGLPYLFQLLAAGQSFKSIRIWEAVGSESEIASGKSKTGLELAGTRHTARGQQASYLVAETGEGILGAVTLTDLWLSEQGVDECIKLTSWLEIQIPEPALHQLRCAAKELGHPRLEQARAATIGAIAQAVQELAHAHGGGLSRFSLVAGGGGAPVVGTQAGALLALPGRMAADYPVISAIGAALAVTCASQSRTVADPTGADIAELTRDVEERLAAQGADRVATDYEYDPQRQVLTVTGRGSRAYERDSSAKAAQQLDSQATELLGEAGERVWDSPSALLWVGEKRRRGQPACAQSRAGRCLWLGTLREWFNAEPGCLDETLNEIVSTRTAYTDGGPALPGLALICDGRFIPLDALSSRELISEVLRWENLPADAPGCFVIRN